MPVRDPLKCPQRQESCAADSSGDAPEESHRHPVRKNRCTISLVRAGQDHQVRVSVRREVIDIQAADEVAVTQRAVVRQQRRLRHPARLGPCWAPANNPQQEPRYQNELQEQTAGNL